MEAWVCYIMNGWSDLYLFSSIDLPYFDRALILHYISHASIQMSHVQCFVLMASFLCSVNCLPQAWLLIGQAVRMAQDLGYHVRRPYTKC